MQFGSTQLDEIDEKLSNLTENEILATKVKNAAATWGGAVAEMQIQKQQIKHQQEQINALRGLIMTLQGEVAQIKTQHAIQLSAALRGGATQGD